MATCAAFGLRAAYAGAVGTDDNGRRVGSALADRGVDLSLIVRQSGRQSVRGDPRSSTIRANAWCCGTVPTRLLLADADLPADALRSARAVLVDDVDPRASLEAARLARAAGVPVVTDLDHLTPFTEALVRTASHPVLSEHLPQALTGEGDLERALRALRSWNPGLLTVTVGARGAVALDGDHFVHGRRLFGPRRGYDRIGRRISRRLHRRTAARHAHRADCCALPTPRRRSAAPGRARSTACRPRRS